MGLFGEKQSCMVCGNKVGLLNAKIKDGVICTNCSSMCRLEVEKYKTLTVDDVKERIAYLDKNTEKLQAFCETDGVGYDIKIDDNSKTWILPKNKHYMDNNVEVFNFTDIIDYELNEDGETITKGGLGSAVAGGVLLGGVGAIVGGGLGKKNKAVVNRMYIRVSLSNKWVKNISINLLNTETKKNGFVYKSIKTNADKMISLFDFMVKQNQVNTAPVNTNISMADELIKLKGLLDAGILTQAEFDVEKFKLLNR
jgi:hypothetical protein